MHRFAEVWARGGLVVLEAPLRNTGQLRAQNCHRLLAERMPDALFRGFAPARHSPTIAMFAGPLALHAFPH